MSAPRSVLVVGATGYIGQQVVRELVSRGHTVRCLVRALPSGSRARALEGAQLTVAEVTDRASIARALEGVRLDAVVSCLATRTGGVADSWRVEHQANLDVLEASRAVGASHFVLLSAICVQRPTLAFQHAKLAFELALRTSGLRWSIVRPTAFFKSLSGQVERVKQGKPFLVFGDGLLTSCAPISEADLARFLADCLDDPAKHDAVLPVGGPGPALTPLAQGALLFAACGRSPRYRHVPVALLDVIITVLAALGRFSTRLADKAEYARIGRYYATESMLVFDPASARYDDAATPRFGAETLEAFYARVVREGLAGQELGSHALGQAARD
jgi:divinyl chlorophyllide a 8-vinyl-reductase